jgi:outer membrane protein insertion porin family
MIFSRYVLLTTAALTLAFSSTSMAQGPAARPPRVLKFTGVPMAQGQAVKKKFPFVFEREITLSEVDEVVRFLMKSGAFSNVEVIERPVEDQNGQPSEARELVLVGSLLRRIDDITIRGNREIPTSDVLRILNVGKGQTFERKNLLASSEDLRKAYEDLGFHNAKVEIEFALPNDQGVAITVKVDEGIPVRVNEVVVDTPNPDLTKRLLRMSKSLKSKALTEDTLLEFQKSVQEWLQDNRFLTSKLSQPAVVYNVDRTLAKLTYTVENPWRFEFRVDGNSYFTEGTIIRRLEGEKLAGAVSSPAPDMAEKIRGMYQEVGFANVEVTYTDRHDDKNQKQKIAFKIKENPRVRIKKIEVSGNVSRPESYYAQFIKSSSSDLTGSGYYNRNDIDEGAKRLVTELQNQGYLRAKVQSQRAEYSKEKKSVVVTLSIDEGPLTQIRQIRVEGTDSYPKAQIIEMLKIRTGAALGLRELEESIQILKNFYRAEGFLEMKIVNETESSRMVTYNEANTQATVEFQIYEGPRVIVGSVLTSGNHFTKDKVITREISFKTGDTLTPEILEDSIFRLQKLGLFSKVNIRMLEEGTNIAERTMIIEVEERDPGLVTTGFGVNNDREPNAITLRGYVGVGYRNLDGTGRGISLRIDPRYSTNPKISYLEHTITLSYLEPYIFGDRNRGRINIVRDQSFYDFNGDSALINETHSIGLLLERDFTRHLKLTYTGYSFANQRRFDRYTRDTIRTQNIAKFGPLVELDYRDDTFNPTKGSYSFVNLEFSDPVIGSSQDENQTINFFKTNASVTTYTRLTKRNDVVWANSVRGGFLANVSGDAKAGIPAQEAFFLGGRSTIRGFDAVDERLPHLQDLGVANLDTFFVRNTETFYLLKTELRFPIFGSVGGTIFYDGGAVLLNQPGIDIADPYRDSVGAGLRIQTPVGPINFEFGWKLDRKYIVTAPVPRQESAWAFHFSIGSF